MSVQIRRRHLGSLGGRVLLHSRPADGQKLECLTVINARAREGQAFDVAERLRLGRAFEVLSGLFCNLGAPRFLHAENGHEFVSMAVHVALERNGVESCPQATKTLWPAAVRPTEFP